MVNTPRSGQGNFIRYIIYLIAYIVLIGATMLVVRKTPLHLWDLIFLGIVSAMVLLFYIYRFNREQRFFNRQFVLPLLGNYSFAVIMTLIIAASRILFSYLQAYGHIPKYSFQENFIKIDTSTLFWVLIIVQGIVIPTLQIYLSSGFFFNYLFRDTDVVTGIIGMIISGLIFSTLNFQFSLPLLLINIVYGILFAWSYLYTQTIITPIYLAIVNGIMMVILM